MCGDSGGGSGSGGGDGGGDGAGGSDGVGGGATVVATLREGGGDSGRDHGEVGVHGEGAWKAEAGQTCHGGGARTNTKAFKAWVDESAGGWDEGAFWGRGKLGLVLTLRSPPRRLDELCDGGRPRRVVPPPPRHGDSNPDL